MPETTLYRVIVAEDEPKIRRNIVQKIENAALPFAVVGTASNGQEALHMIRSMKPDVLFTDIRMPKLDGLAMIRQAIADCPDLQVVIVSGYSEFDYAKQALKMGVKDYLLKPLDAKAVQDILISLQDQLKRKNAAAEKSVLPADMAGYSAVAKDASLRGGGFLLFLICIGNLCSPVATANQIAFYHRIWSAVPLIDIGGGMAAAGEKWWIVDEKSPNQKMLILPAGERSPAEIRLLAEKLQSAIADCVPQLPVNIAYSGTRAGHAELLENAKALCLVLDRGLVTGQSGIFALTDPAAAPHAPLLVTPLLQNKIAALAQAGEADALRRELQNALNGWQQKKYPQKWVAGAVKQLMRIIAASSASLTEQDLYFLEHEIDEKLAMLTKDAELFPEVWNLCKRCLTDQVPEADAKRLAEQIAEYLRLNFAKTVSIDELAQKYHFSLPYFSKLFKKHYGESPVKYLTRLRIDAAKQLMLDNPRLEIGVVGEIVGYADQHYFSRIFKNTTGLSPTEFKERFCGAWSDSV